MALSYASFKAKANDFDIYTHKPYIGIDPNTHILEGVFGTHRVVFYESKADVDTDGAPDPSIHRWDGDHQGQTSFDPSGKIIDAETLCYMVLPGGFPGTVGSYASDITIPLGTVVYVSKNGKSCFAVFADTGPRTKIGEASLHVHTALGNENVRWGRIRNVGIDDGVTFAILVGCAVPLIGLNQSVIDAAGEAHFAVLGLSA